MPSFNPMDQHEQKPKSEPVVGRKIPISLSVVSYYFFTIGLLTAILGFVGVEDTRTNLRFTPFIMLIQGVLYVFISRGLRRCSRGWYICAVIIAFLAPIWSVCLTVYYFLSIDFQARAFPFGFLFIMFFSFLIEVWVFLVLTRADVRALFDRSRKRAA